MTNLINPTADTNRILAEARDTLAEGVAMVSAKHGATHPALLPAMLTLAEAERVLALGANATADEWALVRFHLLAETNTLIDAYREAVTS